MQPALGLGDFCMRPRVASQVRQPWAECCNRVAVGHGNGKWQMANGKRQNPMPRKGAKREREQGRKGENGKAIDSRTRMLKSESRRHEGRKKSEGESRTNYPSTQLPKNAVGRV